MPETAELRIGIDAREVLGRPTGVGRYVTELLTRWTRRADAGRRRLLLYAPAVRGQELHTLAAAWPAGTVEICEVAGTGGAWWEQVQLPRIAARHGLDVFFAPAYAGPLRLRVPVVVTIHDVSYIARPEWFPWLNGLRRRRLTQWSAARAAVILTGTEFSRHEIATYLNVGGERVVVIPYGVTAPQRDGLSVEDVSGREPLVLYVGSILNRRHVPDLMRAFARIATRHGGARLIITGENRTHPPENPRALADALDLGDRVEFRSYVSDDELGLLYARARVFAFLSEYEGFGMPPLEALSAGIPSVVYDTPIAREAYQGAASFVPVGDIAGVATAIDRLLADDHERQRVLASGPGVLARYSWDRCADATLAAIERVAARRLRQT